MKYSHYRGLPILISTGSHFSNSGKLQKAVTSGIVVSQFSPNEIWTNGWGWIVMAGKVSAEGWLLWSSRDRTCCEIRVIRRGMPLLSLMWMLSLNDQSSLSSCGKFPPTSIHSAPLLLQVAAITLSYAFLLISYSSRRGRMDTARI